jgi:hypothetical protein
MRTGYELSITVGGSLPRGRPATVEEATLAVEHMGGQLDFDDYGWEGVEEVYIGAFPDDVADQLDAAIDGDEWGLDGWWVHGPDGDIEVEVLVP